jgi:hypothetical protein
MGKATDVTESQGLFIGFYFQALTRILGEPGQFFRELPEEPGFRKPFAFLIISSLFFAGASLTHLNQRPVLMAGILLMNAVAMPFITAGIGFIVMAMTVGRLVSFSKLFAVYAFAAGATLLVSWIPLFVWFAEPWKWLLIALGMVKGCGMGWIQATLFIGLSIFILVLFFWSLTPLIFFAKGLLSQ